MFTAASVRPATVALVLAEQTRYSDCIVVLIGCVESEHTGHVHRDISLNDGSGRIGVRDFSNGPSALGRYVQVIGRLLRWLATCSQLHIIASSVTSIDSADRVSYYLIEVAYTWLRLRQELVSKRISH